MISLRNFQTRPDPAWPDPTWSNPIQPDPTRSNPIQPDPTRPNPTWPDPAIFILFFLKNLILSTQVELVLGHVLQVLESVVCVSTFYHDCDFNFFKSWLFCMHASLLTLTQMQMYIFCIYGSPFNVITWEQRKNL